MAVAEWAGRVRQEGVWWAPAQTPAEVVEDPSAVGQRRDRDDRRRQKRGRGSDLVNGPVSFSDYVAGRGVPVPALGQHTEEVLLELDDQVHAPPSGRP